MNRSHVILVVDRTFGMRLRELPKNTPTWIVDSSENHPAIVACAKERKAESHLDGITWFRDFPDISPADLAASMIDTIDEHHGVHSQKVAFSRLTVIGTAAAPALDSSLEEVGFHSVSATESAVEYERKRANQAPEPTRCARGSS